MRHWQDWTDSPRRGGQQAAHSRSWPRGLHAAGDTAAPTPVWWFRNSLHFIGECVKRISEPNHTRILRFLVSFESEVRLRGLPRNDANFGFGTPGLLFR